MEKIKSMGKRAKIIFGNGNKKQSFLPSGVANFF
jgi:hypothetical protein